MAEFPQQLRAALAMAASPTAVPERRLLLIKLGAIGDVVMAIPAAAARHAEGYAVDWVCSEVVAPVLRLYPWIHVIEVDEPKLLRGSVRQRMAGVRSLWRALGRRVKEAGAYDLIATLYYDHRYRFLTLPLRATRKVNLSRTDRRFTLLPGRHHTDEYDRILGGRADGERPVQLAPVRPPSLPPPARAMTPDRPRVVLAPAGARNVLREDALRRWPMENYVALAAALLADGCEVVLAGGPEDAWATAHFRELGEAARPDSLLDLIGQLSLVETLALLDSAKVTVTHDTGPLHLAGITSTAIVTVFGPTDPHGRLPHRANCVAIWGGEGFACRPCYDGRNYAPCEHNGCLTQITPGVVLGEVRTLLRARDQGRSLPPRVITPGAEALVQLPGARRGMMNPGQRALFLDRDGVINHEVGYLHRPEDVRWVEGIFSLCRRAGGLGYRLVVVTNQAGIGRGLYTTEDFEALMGWMREEFRARGAALDAVYHCPFHPEHGVGKWRREHEDRKPGPGMLLRAARDLGVDLASSLLVGDRCTDVGAANAAGLKRAFLLAGTEREACDGEYTAVLTLGEVEAWLESNG